MKIRYPQPDSVEWAFMRWADIPSKQNPGQVYLRRLRIVQTPWTGLYLHWINEPDTDRDAHDHPWTFWSLVLRGGYSEDVLDRLDADPRSQHWRRGTLHRMSVDRAHRITIVRPGTMTLVLTGPRVRVWCFWTETGLVSWREYLGRDQDPADHAPEA